MSCGLRLAWRSRPLRWSLVWMEVRKVRVWGVEGDEEAEERVGKEEKMEEGMMSLFPVKGFGLGDGSILAEAEVVLVANPLCLKMG
mmetsp:Transcript_5741/g.12504  ORF Transcript_5741/g.12504 Transcript_5741/m.12504 type:complete len:86 (+) Transcript_5741:304-561(+)